MADSDSFAELMSRLRAGEEHAAQKVFQRYVHRLITLACLQLDSQVRSKVDPEDVVQSVYKSFFHRYSSGQLDVAGWRELWGLLVIITLRKCANRAKYYRRECRDPGREVSTGPAGEDSGPRWEAIDPEPTPLEAALLTETVEGLLRDMELPERQIIELSLQGYTVQEIKQQLGRAERTVRRVRQRVREKLERMQAAS
jgi:RNA polymerase sigma-70 factor (ECF subfamily)